LDGVAEEKIGAGRCYPGFPGPGRLSDMFYDRD